MNTKLPHTIEPRALALIGGVSYMIIFFAAIFANFMVLEALLRDPLATVQQHHFFVRAGILAFLITAVFDIVVAWVLYLLYQDHILSGLSMLFRMTHAVIMGAAVFALVLALQARTAVAILKQVEVFNTIWLIGLFFFGVHLILLGRILKKPSIIALFLVIAGIMYMLDTAAHFMLVNYADYASVFLTLVAVPSIFGEMALSVWLLIKGGRANVSG